MLGAAMCAEGNMDSTHGYRIFKKHSRAPAKNHLSLGRIKLALVPICPREFLGPPVSLKLQLVGG
jgi:hypothetical protein